MAERILLIPTLMPKLSLILSSSCFFLLCVLSAQLSFLGGNSDVSVYSKTLEDGLHLSAKGEVLLYDGLMDVIKRDLPHLVPKVNEDDLTGISMEGAQWKDLC